jgi:hypothetical protein
LIYIDLFGTDDVKAMNTSVWFQYMQQNLLSRESEWVDWIASLI